MDKRLELIGDIAGAEKLLFAGCQSRGEDPESVEDALRVIRAECDD